MLQWCTQPGTYYKRFLSYGERVMGANHELSTHTPRTGLFVVFYQECCRRRQKDGLEANPGTNFLRKRASVLLDFGPTEACRW